MKLLKIRQDILYYLMENHIAIVRATYLLTLHYIRNNISYILLVILTFSYLAFMHKLNASNLIELKWILFKRYNIKPCSLETCQILTFIQNIALTFPSLLHFQMWMVPTYMECKNFISQKQWNIHIE